MPALARVIPWLVLVFALLALALGLYEWSHPPFADEQLRASLTNTWEVAASTTRVFGIVFLIVESRNAFFTTDSKLSVSR